MVKGFWKGAMWLEVFIPLAIVVVLVILTIPYFSRFKCRAKQSEARMELMNLYNAEQFYHAQNATFASLEILRSSKLVSLKEKYYSFEMSYLNGTAFEITAFGKPKTQVENDVWSISHEGKVQHSRNACVTK